MVIAGTGHRPIDYSEEERLILMELAEMAISEFQPTKIISGMALGWDTAIAEVAIREGIPLLAAIPFEGQESRWREENIVTYRGILNKASEVVIVCEGGFSRKAMQLRNEYMVDNSDLLIAWYDSSRRGSGTGNCIRYANSVGREWKNYWECYEMFLNHKTF